ncbi:hypothetical protein V6N12_062624 [Hibiscus sabdariffa]|uniref:Uncharacterized protein n=1 Tax=Hibiscus sabdariffa TaxID=183260 RepID=A0ABR2F9N7_9ROSI
MKAMEEIVDFLGEFLGEKSPQDCFGCGNKVMETLLVYVKDDFFDSLSCDSLAGGSRNGRTRFSEQMTRDTETFGDSLRHRCGRGGHGPFHGGQVVLIMEEAMVMAGERSFAEIKLPG